MEDTSLKSPLAIIKDACALAFRREHVWLFLVLGAAPQIVSIVFSAVVGYYGGLFDAQTSLSQFFTSTGGLGVAAAIVGLVMVVGGLSVASTWYTALLYHVYAGVALGKKLTITGAMQLAWGSLKRLFLTYLKVSIVTGLGYLFLIVPGVLFTVWYLFAPLAAVVEEDAVDAMAQSKRMVKGRFWKLVGRSLVLLLLYTAPQYALSFLHPYVGVAWQVTSPIFGLMYMLLYLDFKRTYITTPMVPQVQPL